MIHQTVSNCLKHGTELLNSSGIPEAQFSAETLLSHVLERPRFSLYLGSDEVVNEAKRLQFESLLTKRANRFPLQYLIKRIPFHNVTLEIGEGCLIPRPETEILVEVVLKTLDSAHQEILDIGTGSGNIPVSLAQERPNWSVMGTDLSAEALKYAQLNAHMNSVDDRVRFMRTDLWQGLEDKHFDALVSNPPYLTSMELDSLQPEIVFEPRGALDGGRDGLDFFKRIIQNAHAILKPNGFIFFEVGLYQTEQVRRFLSENGFHNIQHVKDDAGIDRIVFAQLNTHG
jgi:release factor glutamine methyltransferase